MDGCWLIHPGLVQQQCQENDQDPDSVACSRSWSKTLGCEWSESYQVLLKNSIFHDSCNIIRLPSSCPALFCLFHVGTGLWNWLAASGLWDLRVTWACPGCAAKEPSALRYHTAKNKQQSQLLLLRVLLGHPLPNIDNILNTSAVTQIHDPRSASNILYQNNVSWLLFPQFIQLHFY